MANPRSPHDATPELPGMDAVRAETGLAELPEGAGELTAKELLFVQHLLRTGKRKASAIAAGYSERTAAQMASEVMTKPRVANFYRRCLERLGADTRAIVARTEERARLWHHQALAAHESGDAEALETASKAGLEHDRVLLQAAGKIGGKLELSGEVGGGALPAPLSNLLTAIRQEELTHGA